MNRAALLTREFQKRPGEPHRDGEQHARIPDAPRPNGLSPALKRSRRCESTERSRRRDLKLDSSAPAGAIVSSGRTKEPLYQPNPRAVANSSASWLHQVSATISPSLLWMARYLQSTTEQSLPYCHSGHLPASRVALASWTNGSFGIRPERSNTTLNSTTFDLRVSASMCKRTAEECLLPLLARRRSTRHSASNRNLDLVMRPSARSAPRRSTRNQSVQVRNSVADAAHSALQIGPLPSNRQRRSVGHADVKVLCRLLLTDNAYSAQS